VDDEELKAQAEEARIEIKVAQGDRKPSLDDLVSKPKPKPDWPS
jgi:hypothetical protein